MNNILHIKNMVCDRCTLVVKQILNDMKIEYSSVNLGEIKLKNSIKNSDYQLLSKKLSEVGFELIDDKKQIISEKIKSSIITWVQSDMDAKTNLSDYLSFHLQLDYPTISIIFSETEGITIEKFQINQRIEKVKELLIYDELSLKEIANQLNYSSTAYLSNQFKKITGQSPSQFKTKSENRRIPLDKI